MSETSVIREDEEATAFEYSLWSRLGAEALGTFILVFVGVGLALFAVYTSGGSLPLSVGLAFGVALFAAISAFGHISGGHFNPAVSLGLAVTGRFDWKDLPLYVVAQAIGGAIAGAVLFITVNSNELFRSPPEGSTVPTVEKLFLAASNTFGVEGNFGTWELPAALLIEVAATAAFVSVILGMTSKKHPKPAHAPLAISLALAGLIMVTLPITNASLNPARSTASALFGGGDALGDLWLFWVAPLAGGLIAALFTLGFTPLDRPVLELALDDGADDSELLVEETVVTETSSVTTSSGDSGANPFTSSSFGETATSVEGDSLAVADEGSATSEDSTLPAGAVASAADGSAPEGHLIKGVSASGLYHAPGSRWYDSAEADFWFASPEDAEAAGLKKAGARKKS